MAEEVVWSLSVSLLVFAVAVVTITGFGIMMTLVASQLAEQTGLGQALMGALFVGGSTSLAEIATSTTAAYNGHPDLAVSNAVGSIAGQTAMLAVADLAYHRANLEHAAASAENLMMSVFLITLLAIPLLAAGVPDISLWSIHPASLGLVVTYIWGMRLVSQAHKQPMWHPRETPETRVDDGRAPGRGRHGLAGLWMRFIVACAFMTLAGWLLARSAVGISVHSGLSETVVGGLFTGLSSSLPELITAVTAVRIGQLTLAVGDVLGGNAFDTLVVVMSDVAYRQGSIYAAISQQQYYLISLAILLTGILAMGLVRREKHGIANIGTESFLVLFLYVGAFSLLFIFG